MVKSINKRIILGFVIVFIFIIMPKNSFAMSKIELSSTNGSVLWSTSNMGDNYPIVRNVKYILIYFDINIMPNSRYNLSAQWSFSTLGTTRNRPTLNYLLLNGNNTQFSHSLGVNEETNFQSYYYHWYTDSISFTNTNFSGTTQVQLTYTLPNVSSISQISWHDKGLTFVGSTSSDTNSTINSAASNIINNQNQNTNSIINNNNSNTNRIIESQENINDTLNDSTTDDPSGDITNMNSKIATNGSISQLLTLPITLYQSILNSTTGSCSDFNLGSLLGTNITLPCINLSNLLGSTLYNIIDILISGLFILSFRKKMVDIFNHMTSLNDRGNELE